jgi:hypothetical protein
MDSFKQFISNHSDGDIIFRYLQNMKIEDIVTETGHSVGEIYRILRRNHINPNRLKGNHAQVLYYHNAGFPIPQIAEYTGYTERNIRYILHNNLSEGK